MGTFVEKSLSLRSSTMSLSSLFQNRYFLPAAVQREFQWGISECSALLSDFERAWRENRASASNGGRDQPYFLGSFVLRPQTDGRLEVFDGLQRLTTLTILFSVLRDIVDDVDPHWHRTLANAVHDGSGQPRLKLSGEDQTLANLIQTKSEAVRRRRNLSANSLRARLLTAAGYFGTRIRDFPEEHIIEFANFILSSVFVGVIEVADEALARQIFITTNNRGLPLNEADVLKSQINSIPRRQDVADRVLSSWDRVRESFDHDWEYEAFLYAVDFRTRKKGKGAEGLTALGEFLGRDLDDSAILEWIVEYEETAKVWHWLTAVKENPAKYDPTKGSLGRLFCFDWTEWHAVAIQISSDYLKAVQNRDKRRQKTALARFDQVEKACLALTILETPEVDRVQIMLRALSDLKGGRSLHSGAFEKVQSLTEQVDLALSAPMFEPETAFQFLKWWETLNAPRSTTDFSDYKVAKVMPSSIVEFSEWDSLFPDKDDRWLLAHSLGNLLIVPKQLDVDEAADSFKAFKKQSSRHKSASSEISAVLKHSLWTPDAIKKRSNRFRTKTLDYLQSN